MLSPDVLTKFMDTNQYVLGKQLDGLTHEDSILQVALPWELPQLGDGAYC